MAKRLSGLGRGLGALIPQKQESAAEEAPPRMTSAPPASEAPEPSSAPRATATDVARPNGGVLEVPVGNITANPEQPRTSFRHRELEDLMNSIREHGIIQPLTVSPLGGGKYELIAGERRFRAANMLGLETVPVIVREGSDAHGKLLLALIENIQREDLNPMEEAKAYERLASEFALTQEEIARRVGKARSTVANTLRLLDLPKEVQEAIADGAVSAGSARAILGLKDEKSRIRLFRKLMGSRMTTRDVEAGVQRTRGASRKDPALLDAEAQLRNAFGTKADVRKRDGKGAIAFAFYSDEEYSSLLERLLA